MASSTIRKIQTTQHQDHHPTLYDTCVWVFLSSLIEGRETGPNVYHYIQKDVKVQLFADFRAKAASQFLIPWEDQDQDF